MLNLVFSIETSRDCVCLQRKIFYAEQSRLFFFKRFLIADAASRHGERI